MKTDNWEKAKEIFGDALRLAPDARSHFLDDVCAGDLDMRREVESLLSSHDSAESFLETSAVANVAGGDRDENRRLEAGESLGHYEIVRQIGTGGMGEVYLATDQKLDRRAAIKVLNKQFAEHESNLRRFTREAKLASALNHPNILTVYEVGEIDSFRYIVTEFVDGQTLRDYFNCGPIPLRNGLKIIIDIARALSTAHDAGIIHRDIKPENIMVRKDGLVKVLDFGLAKLTEADAANDSLLVTAPGMIMGTPKYMSPEQIRGFDVDRTSDVFSLGVVFYEMAAGVPPFDGVTVSDIIASVLTREPPPLIEYNREIPPDIQSIIRRCLEKESSTRYQTLTSLVVELERCDPGGKFSSGLQNETPQFSAATDEYRTLIGNTDPNAAQTNPISGNSNEHGPVKRNDRKRSLAYASAAAAVIILLLALPFWLGSRNAKQIESIGGTSPKPAPTLYWQMAEDEQLAFIEERARDVQAMIGDEPTQFDDDALRSIKIEIDDYVEKKDSLSQKQFEEGLRAIYGRGSQYAPLVIRAYETQRVPPTLGLYQAMIESEYHDCPVPPFPNAPVGMFQFSRRTAAKYGLLPSEYCNVEKQSEAAARHMSDLASDFGDGRSNATLGLLSYMIGAEGVRDYLRQLRRRGIPERSYWAILRHRKDLQPELEFLPPPGLLIGRPLNYVPRFFAAAIIGETPEVFGLSTPPLTTLRTNGT